MMLREGKRLPFATGQVLHVCDQVVAEDIEHFAFELVAFAKRLFGQVQRPNEGFSG